MGEPLRDTGRRWLESVSALRSRWWRTGSWASLHGLNLALALIAYRPLLSPSSAKPLAAEVEDWFFQSSDTGPLVVLAMSAWLLYRRRARLQQVDWQRGPAWLGAAFFAPAVVAFGWYTYTDARELLPIPLVLSAFGCAAHFGGRAALRAVRLPALFLLFAVPIPGPLANWIVFHFQIWTTHYASWLLSLLGVTSFVSGDLVVLSSDTFSVIEGCSGMRSVLTLTMVAILLVDLFRRSGAPAAAIVIAAPFVAFAANGLRVLTLILNPHSEIVAIHNLQGAVILIVGVIVLYGLDGLFARFFDDAGVSLPSAPGGRADPARDRSRWWPTAALALMLALSLWLPRYDPPPKRPMNLATRIPGEIAGLTGQRAVVDVSFLGTVAFSQTLARRYERADDGAAPSFDLFVGVGEHDRSWRSPVSPKTAFPGSGWRVRSEGTTVLEADGGRERRVTEQVVRSGTETRLVYSWVEGAAGGVIAESLRALAALDQGPTARTRPAVVVRISTDVSRADPDALQDAARRLLDFYRALRDDLDAIGRDLARNSFS